MYAPITPLIAPEAPTVGTALPRVGHDVGGRGQDAAEHDEADVPHRIFDVVSEDPHEPHIADRSRPFLEPDHRAEAGEDGGFISPCWTDNLQI